MKIEIFSAPVTLAAVVVVAIAASVTAYERRVDGKIRTATAERDRHRQDIQETTKPCHAPDGTANRSPGGPPDHGHDGPSGGSLDLRDEHPEGR